MLLRAQTALGVHLFFFLFLGGVHLNGESDSCQSSLGAERQLRASNELCAFTARLMETPGDLSRSLSLFLSVGVCVRLPLSQRQAHSPAP